MYHRNVNIHLYGLCMKGQDVERHLPPAEKWEVSGVHLSAGRRPQAAIVLADNCSLLMGDLVKGSSLRVALTGAQELCKHNCLVPAGGSLLPDHCAAAKQLPCKWEIIIA